MAKLVESKGSPWSDEQIEFFTEVTEAVKNLKEDLALVQVNLEHLNVQDAYENLHRTGVRTVNLAGRLGAVKRSAQCPPE